MKLSSKLETDILRSLESLENPSILEYSIDLSISTTLKPSTKSSI